MSILQRSGTFWAFHIALLLASFGLTLALAVATNAAPGRDTRQSLAPHKALYDIEMISRNSGTSVLNISGRMYFELQENCDAWTTDHRFNLLYEYSDSAPMRITSDFSTYEPFDGRSLDFSSRRRRNGELYEELRGRATTGGAEKNEALYSVPSSLHFDLTPDTIFPMNHTLTLLRHMRDNKTFFKAVVFDGSDEEGPVEINSFIGKPASPPADLKTVKAVDQTLIGTPARRVRMAFFPTLLYETGADYEMSAILHENGIISDMVIEYKDFSIEQKLVALEPLDRKPCGTAGQPPAKP